MFIKHEVYKALIKYKTIKPFLTALGIIFLDMLWFWYNILEYVLLSGIVVIHIVALVLLRRSRYSIRYKNQVIIITALCMCELTGAILLIAADIFEYYVSLLVGNIIFCFTEIFILFNYYFIMVLLTVDRFLAFYLNLKYQFYFSPSKALSVLVVAALVCLLITVTVAVLISKQIIMQSQLFESLYFFYVAFDGLYIFLALGTYSFIFRMYRRQLKFREDSHSSRNKDQFKLLIPTLIIVTFIIFISIPNIINTVYRQEISTTDKAIVYLAFTFYRIGWLIDPLIYIFFSACSKNTKQVKEKTRSMSLLARKPPNMKKY